MTKFIENINGTPPPVPSSDCRNSHKIPRPCNKMFINHITRAFSSCVFYNLTMVSIIHPNASIIHVSQTDIDLILPAWSLFSIATFFVFGPIHILLKQRQASQGPSQWAEVRDNPNSFYDSSWIRTSLIRVTHPKPTPNSSCASKLLDYCARLAF